MEHPRTNSECGGDGDVGGDGMKPIYEPKGKAKEYGDYALNIYTGCPHRCYYCFAPSVLLEYVG